MADIEGTLYALENRMLNEGAGQYLTAIDDLKRLVALGDPGIAAFIASMPVTVDLAAAAAQIQAAYTTSMLDAGAIVATTATPAQLGTIVDRSAKPPPIDLTGIASRIAQDWYKARLLLAIGEDPAVAAATMIGGGNATKAALLSALTGYAAAGTVDAGRIAQKPLVWVAERNACVHCLAHSGHVVEPGGSFPAGLTYGPKAYYGAPKAPPLHPRCRCHLEVLNDPEYAAALRREADRSVLRGYSLESESMRVRVDAAKRLIDRGVDAPASVIGYGAKAVKAGKFPTRVVPKTKPGDPGRPHGPETPTPKPPTPEQPRHPLPTAAEITADLRRKRDEAAAAKLKATMDELARVKAERAALAKLQAKADYELKRTPAQAAIVAKYGKGALDPKVPIGKTLEKVPIGKSKTATVKEYAAIANARYPETNFVRWERSGIDPIAARQAISAIGNALDRYKGIRLTSVGVGAGPGRRFGPRVLAQAGAKYDVVGPRRPDGSRRVIDPYLELSTKLLGDQDELYRLLNYSAEQGHFHGGADDGVANTVVHEFGHVLDYNTQYQLRGIYSRMLATERAAHGGNGSKEAYEWAKGNISGYGRTSPAEGVAEAMADVATNGADAFPFSKEVAAAIEKYIAEKGFDNE